MIGRLQGTVVERRAVGEAAVELVVDVGGVGYRVLATPRAAAAFPLDDREHTVSVHTHVREGAITLYGFGSSVERATFELLIGAHGVGPGLALAILGVHSPVELSEIVVSGNVDALKLVPGVGAKTAARLLLELQVRLDVLELGASGDTVAGNGTRLPSAAAEVGEALTLLGYAPDEIRAALNALPPEGSVEDLLRTALRQMAPRQMAPRR